MKSRAIAAALAAAGLLCIAHGTFAADGKPTVSKNVAKPLQAAKEAIDGKRYVEGLAKLKEVEGIAGKTPYDEYIINELRGFAAARAKDLPEAAHAFEASLDSGYVDQADVPTRVRMLAQLNYNLKNYDKAIEFGNRAIKGGFADDEIYTTVGQAYFLKGDYKNSQRLLDTFSDIQTKRGQTPKEQTLQLILSSCSKLLDAKNKAGEENTKSESDCITRSLERLVAHYPKPEYWQNLMYSMFQSQDHSESQAEADRNMLQVYRLASEVDVLKRADDYTNMAQLAIDQGSPGEAVRILQKGFEKKVFPDARSQNKNKRLLDLAQRKAATDQATLAKMDKDAAAAANGDRDIGVGLAYLSYQQYDKAVAALTRGLAKPGVRNEANARLLLGIAQLEAGKKDDAVKTFRSVKGDPKLERLASLWGLHARQAIAFRRGRSRP